MGALRANFLGADFRPVALTAGSRALVRVVDDLQWLCRSGHRRHGPGAARADARTGGPGAAGLRAGPAASPSPAPESSNARSWPSRLIDPRTVAIGSYRQDIVDILAEPDDDDSRRAGPHLLNRRTIGAAIGVTGRLIASAAAADARPVWARVLGRRLPETGIAERVYSGDHRGHRTDHWLLATRSVTVRNSAAHRPRPGAGRRRHASCSRSSTDSGWCSARCRCCAAAR